MNLETEKIYLAKLLLETHNPKIIEAIKKIFEKNEISDFWNDLFAEQKQEIDQASLEIKNGETTDYESFIKKHR